MHDIVSIEDPCYVDHVLCPILDRIEATCLESRAIRRVYSMVTQPHAVHIETNAEQPFLRAVLALPDFLDGQVALYGLCAHPGAPTLGWASARITLDLDPTQRAGLLRRLLYDPHPDPRARRLVGRAAQRATPSHLLCHESLARRPARGEDHAVPGRRKVAHPQAATLPAPSEIVESALPHFGSPALARHVAEQGTRLLRHCAMHGHLNARVLKRLSAERRGPLLKHLRRTHRGVWTTWLRTMATDAALEAYLSMRSAPASALKGSGADALLALIDDEGERPGRTQAARYAPALARATLFHRPGTLPMASDRAGARALATRLLAPHPKAAPEALARIAHRTSLHLLPPTDSFSETCQLLLTASHLPGATRHTLHSVLRTKSHWRALASAYLCARRHMQLCGYDRNALPCRPELEGLQHHRRYPAHENAAELYVRTRAWGPGKVHRLQETASAISEATNILSAMLYCAPDRPTRVALEKIWLAPWTTPRIPSIRSLIREHRRWAYHSSDQIYRRIRKTLYQVHLHARTLPRHWISPDPGIEEAIPLTSAEALCTESFDLGHCAWTMICQCLEPTPNTHFYSLRRHDERSTLALVEHHPFDRTELFEISQHEGPHRCTPSVHQQRLAKDVCAFANDSARSTAAQSYDIHFARELREHFQELISPNNALGHEAERHETWSELHTWRGALAAYPRIEDWMRTLRA